MKITEISDHILDAIRDNRFVGDFTVTISHPCMQEDVEVTGYKRTSAEFPYAFKLQLQSEINKICFKIVSDGLSNEDFGFAINGRVEYEYTPEE